MDHASRIDLTEAMHSITPSDARMFYAWAVLGLSHREIAEIEGRPRRRITEEIAQIRYKLRAALHNDAEA